MEFITDLRDGLYANNDAVKAVNTKAPFQPKALRLPLVYINEKVYEKISLSTQANTLFEIANGVDQLKENLLTNHDYVNPEAHFNEKQTIKSNTVKLPSFTTNRISGISLKSLASTKIVLKIKDKSTANE